MSGQEGWAGGLLSMPVQQAEGAPMMPQNATTRPGVPWKYTNGRGNPATEYPDNPNGSPDAIAGVTDDGGLVLGLMPHPERASLPAHYSQDGLCLFENLVRFLRR